MQEADNAEYRLEQMRAVEILREFFDVVKTEYVIKLKPLECIRQRNAKADIVLLNEKIVIRLNGPVHFSSSKRRKYDSDQRIILEFNNWHVVDFNYDELPELWKGINKDLYREEIKNKLKIT